MEFVKMEGLGNDFIVIEGPIDPSPETIASWCNRRFGIGADGVLEVAALGADRVGMRYWNADGGEAEMCGNGLRCVARYANDRGWVGSDGIVVATAMGDMPAQVLDDGRVRALVGEAQLPSVPVEYDDLLLHPVSVGNPHVVVFVDDPDTVAVGVLGPGIECDPQFPNRTNVEFVTPTGPNHIRMRVWERGVGETLASGTGATAGAYAAVRYRDVDTPVTVTLPGGELVIELVGSSAWMIGPATTVFTGNL